MEFEFLLVFNVGEFCQYVMSELHSIGTMCFRQKLLDNVIYDFKDKGYKFNHIAEMIFRTIANKRELSYDFYIKLVCVLWSGN